MLSKTPPLVLTCQLCSKIPDLRVSGIQVRLMLTVLLTHLLLLSPVFFFFPGGPSQWCAAVSSSARAKSMPPKSSTPKSSQPEVRGSVSNKNRHQKPSLWLRVCCRKSPEYEEAGALLLLFIYLVITCLFVS